jgi:hypothetical protein
MNISRTALIGAFGVLIVGAMILTLLGLAVAVDHTSYDIWGAIWIGPALILITLPLIKHAVRVEGDASIGRILLLGALVKVIGASLIRYWVDLGLYHGSDVVLYHHSGAELAPLFRSGIYKDLGKVTGTRFTEILTGHVYALVGPSRLGGFMVFSWLAYVGLYLFWRAFRIAVPDGDHHRYLLLILFFPSMLLWTSGTGKDAWMILCLGGATYGFAALLSGRWRGSGIMALGLWGAVVVRPHLAVIFLVAAITTIPILLTARRSSRTSGRRGPRLVLLGVVALAAVLVVGRAEDFFDLKQLDVESAEGLTQLVAGNTSVGGSAFHSFDPSTTAGYGKAAATVLFRPFVFEAHNAQGLLAAMESLLLLAVFAASYERLARLPAAAVRIPYSTFAVSYIAAFIYAFAAVENFGILARQRSQLLPLLFVLVALPHIRVTPQVSGPRPPQLPLAALPPDLHNTLPREPDGTSSSAKLLNRGPAEL